MILCPLAHFFRYTAVHPGFAAAAAFMARTDWAAMADGKHAVDEAGTFVILSRYATKPVSAGQLECHRAYIDIQWILTGEERIGWADQARCAHTTPYDSARDIEFFNGPTQWLHLAAGNVAVFFPEDAHMPGIHVQETGAEVRKAVFKVPIG